jgi:hypothetical protein
MDNKLITQGPLKRYLVFGHDAYYPCGGWSDFEGSTDDLDEAIAYCKSSRCDLTDIIDITTGDYVYPK